MEVSVPSRGYLYLYVQEQDRWNYLAEVSVPSRGYLYLYEYWYIMKEIHDVSVPSRGYLYLY